MIQYASMGEKSTVQRNLDGDTLKNCQEGTHYYTFEWLKMVSEVRFLRFWGYFILKSVLGIQFR